MKQTFVREIHHRAQSHRVDIRCRLMLSLNHKCIGKAACYRPVRKQSNAGYTLLELMLALALLGALMTVAWTLMGTYRDAELRGWKLAYRTQTIRAARQWLESDIQHLLRQVAVSPAVNANPARLIGNSLGFTASIAPSIDPLPFLQQALSNPQAEFSASAPQESTANLYSDDDAIIAQAQLALWPAETLQVEYALTPLADQTASTNNSPLQPANPSDLQFSLTRRELLEPSSTLNNGAVAGNASQLDISAERVLTAQDLYRQTDEQPATSGISIRETRLDGLTNVRFQYFDGVSWKPEWHSEQVGGLPLAIALVFDFPPRAAMKPSAIRAPSSGINNASDIIASGDLALSESPALGLSFADAAPATEPIADTSQSSESDLMQSAASEVKIIVYVGGQISALASQRPIGSRTSGDFE